MSNFNPNKLWINYRLSNLNQIQPRRYTLTHSDETGELFLVIGSDFAYEKFTTMRDEVAAEWMTNSSGQYYFYVYIRVDGIDGTKSSTKRNEIFMKELPLALSAIQNMAILISFIFTHNLKMPLFMCSFNHKIQN